MFLFALPNVSIASAGTPCFRRTWRLTSVWPTRSADRDRTGVGDLRHQYLLDEPLVVQFGRRERPNIDPATKHHGYICRREWIGDNPQIRRPPQQGRARGPGQPGEAGNDERGRDQSPSATKPDGAAARRRES